MGRGVREAIPGPDQLCGHCADGVLAISPTGEVWPCVFSRFMPIGNVIEQSLPELVEAQVMEKAREELVIHFGSSDDDDNDECAPDKKCHPECPPRCSPSCSPCRPIRSCWPDYR